MDNVSITAVDDQLADDCEDSRSMRPMSIREGLLGLADTHEAREDHIARAFRGCIDGYFERTGRGVTCTHVHADGSATVSCETGGKLLGIVHVPAGASDGQLAEIAAGLRLQVDRKIPPPAKPAISGLHITEFDRRALARMV